MRFVMHTIQIHKMTMISIPVMPPQTLATMVTVGFLFISSLSGLVLAESDERSITVVTMESVERSSAIVSESVERSITVVTMESVERFSAIVGESVEWSITVDGESVEASM